MRSKRIIPVLLLKDDELYKTVRFSNPQYIGDPINAVKIFNEKDVDEIIIFDIDATVNKKQPNYKLLQEIAAESFVPISYGGGVNDIEIFKEMIQIGYERLCMNSVFYYNQSIISECVEKFGSSSVIIGIDYKKVRGKNFVFVESGKKNTGIEVSDYAKQVETAGAGEIFLNSIDRDGTYQGLDLKVAAEISDQCKIPVIICGGANSLQNIKSAFELNISAVAAGSLFVFYGRYKAVLINYPDKTRIKFFNKING